MRFTKDEEECRLIAACVDRAVALGLTDDVLSLDMDLSCCNANGCELDLKGLLESTASDFAHDIAGIGYHLNHMTGRLKDGFRPRFSKKG